MAKYIIPLGSLLVLVVLLLSPKLYYKNENYALPKRYIDTLANLGIKSLTKLDVPVASIVLFKDSIVGKGYNAVNEFNTIGGHAEINAISDVINTLGKNRFKSIKDSLVLITTFEPCLMCKGAIIENGIKKVVFLKEKSLVHWLKNDVKALRYEYVKQRCGNCGNLQDSLFRLHPYYRE
jgi:tRNA(Arg) A34 adenosine deaminase TadA